MPSKRKLPAPPALPPAPRLTDLEIAAEEQLVAKLEALNRMLRQRCLDNAVLLVQQAAGGRGPLVDHFMELGRRYGDTLDTPQKPTFRVVK